MILNQTVVIWRYTGDVTAPSYTESDTVLAQIYSTTPSVAYERWGVEARRPALLIGKVNNWRNIRVQDRVRYRDMTYVVIAPPKIYEVPGIVSVASHASVLLDELEHK